MDIQVEGSNNRVAGRDYYENQIKPCPTCEIRVIDHDKKKCNHCTKEEQAQLAQGKMVIFGLCVLFVFNWVHGWRAERGLPTDIPGLAEGLFISAALVLGGMSLLAFGWIFVLPAIGEWISERVK